MRQEGNKGKENLQVLKDLELYLRHRLEKLLLKEKGSAGLNGLLTEENLKEKDFGALNEFQVKEMEKRVERLAHKLASRYSYRFKPAKSGRVDMRRVLLPCCPHGSDPGEVVISG